MKTVPPGLGVAPTPNAKAPSATCPSVAETERQLTVYTPTGSSRESVTRIRWDLPGTASTGDTPGTGRPLESTTSTSESLTSAGSVNVSTT